MICSNDADTYVVTSVSFGERPADNIATTALRKIAEMKAKIFPSAAEMIMS